MESKFFQSIGFRKLRNISFGLVCSLFLLWAIFNASSFVPEGLELKFTLAFLGYGVLGVYIFGRNDLKAKLEKISFVKALFPFVLMILSTFFLVSFLLGITDPLPATLITTLIGVPFYMQISNAFIFGVVEGSVFQGVLDEKIGILGSVLVAGFFHMFIWSGSLVANFLGSSFLFLCFSLTNYYFKGRFGKPLALVLSIGVHVGYNLAKYRIIYIVGYDSFLFLIKSILPLF